MKKRKDFKEALSDYNNQHITTSCKEIKLPTLKEMKETFDKCLESNKAYYSNLAHCGMKIVVNDHIPDNEIFLVVGKTVHKYILEATKEKK